MINVMRNKQVVNNSRNTITPITYVPYILLYWNGKPYMKYNGVLIFKLKIRVNSFKNIHNKRQKMKIIKIFVKYLRIA